MKLIRILLLLEIGLLFGTRLHAQVAVRDSSLNINLLYATYGYGMPSGDLAERFGFSNQLGAGYSYKFKNGWLISAEGNFIFRDGVKNQYSILSGISTQDGFVINSSGVFANVMLLQRGFTLWLKVGKLLPVFGPNPNSGLLLQLGGGMMQHKISIQIPDNSVPQLAGDYKKGYDHLCSGPAITQFIGYQHLSNNKRINYYAGAEFVQAFTSSRRAYYFNEMVKADEKRIDILSSLKIGWYLPLYKKTRDRYFYY